MKDALTVLQAERAQVASDLARLDRAIAAMLGKEGGAGPMVKTDGVKAFRRSTPKLRQRKGPLNGMTQPQQVLHILTGGPLTAKGILKLARLNGGTLRDSASVSAVLSTLQQKGSVVKDCLKRPCSYKLVTP